MRHPAPLFIVGCGKSKRPIATSAADLYTGQLFKASRAFAEACGPWRILSAEHGLLKPAEVVAPYNRTVADLKAAERRRWGNTAAAKITRLAMGRDVVLLAGAAYAKPLKAAGLKIAEPLAGLGIGHRLQRLGFANRVAGVMCEAWQLRLDIETHNRRQPIENRIDTERETILFHAGSCALDEFIAGDWPAFSAQANRLAEMAAAYHQQQARASDAN